jgi:hypothetical protein
VQSLLMIDSGWGTTRQSPSAHSSFHGKASVFLPFPSLQLTLQSAFFGNRSPVLFSPPTHLQPNIFLYNHLLSSSCFSYQSKSTNPLVPQHSAFSNTCLGGIISPLPIIVPFVSFHPISGRSAMVGSLMVPRQIVAFGGALKSYQIISSYFVQRVSGSHDSFSGRGSGGEDGIGLWAETHLGFSSLSGGFSCEIKTCKSAVTR